MLSYVLLGHLWIQSQINHHPKVIPPNRFHSELLSAHYLHSRYAHEFLVYVYNSDHDIANDSLKIANDPSKIFAFVWKVNCFQKLHNDSSFERITFWFDVPKFVVSKTKQNQIVCLIWFFSAEFHFFFCHFNNIFKTDDQSKCLENIDNENRFKWNFQLIVFGIVSNICVNSLLKISNELSYRETNTYYISHLMQIFQKNHS